MPIVALLAAFLAAWLCLPDAPDAQPPRARAAIIILAPYLTWEDVTPTATPTLWSISGGDAVGAVNARSRSRNKELTDEEGSVLEGALNVSCGSWAAYDPQAAAAYNAKERYEAGTAADAFWRTTGNQAGENRIVFLGMPVTARVNAESAFGAVPGTLGQAVEDAGGVTAAIGNSDIEYLTGEELQMRPAAVVAMDTRGLVRFGDVSAGLLTQDPYAPFGLKTDPGRFASALEDVRQQVAEVDGPSLVVLDPGDLYRVVRFRPQVTDDAYRGQRHRALAALDRLVADALEAFPGSTVMVVGQSAGDRAYAEPEGLAPIMISGLGDAGYLTSDSTKRAGMVTDLDLTSTVLDALGLEEPVEVLGNAMRTAPSSDSARTRIDRLATMTRTAVSVDSAKPKVVNVFVALAVLVLLLTAFVLLRAESWRPAGRERTIRAVKSALLLVSCIPAAGWLMFAFVRWPVSASQAVVALAATTVGLWVLAMAMWRLRPGRLGVASVFLATAVIVMADQFLGAPASFTNFFGYSPLLAARFYGMGNESAAILFGAAVMGVALLLDEVKHAVAISWVERWGIPALGAVVILSAAAPWLGANVGVAVWGTAGFGLAWMLMNGRRMSWKAALWLALAAACVVAAFAVIDVTGGENTHLAAAIGSAEKGGVGEIWTILARKAETNARILNKTNWSYILIATLVFLGIQRWRPRGEFADTLLENPHVASAVTVSLVAGVIAYFTEDSGIVIPALIAFYVGVALAWLMLSRVARAAAEQPEERTSER